MLREALDSLAPGHDFNRRDFVRVSVGSGFAAAVLPVTAQTVVKTDASGLLAGEVTISSCRPTAPRRWAGKMCRWCC